MPRLTDTPTGLQDASRLFRRARAATVLSLTFLLWGCSPGHPEEPTWYRGNLHTHSLWSDGDDFPEMAIDWYRSAGYDFVALSDHNTVASGDRWISAQSIPASTLQAYVDRFGSDWVEIRPGPADTLIRLKTYPEYASLLEEPGEFLIIHAEEITDRFEEHPVHVNATNLEELIEPQGGSSVRDVMQRNVDAVLDQRRRTGRAIIPHINHPNYRWAVTAEDIASLRGERFFEVYNGHPAANNAGDSAHAGTEQMWDVILADRLRHGKDVIYGLAVDDAHHYQNTAPNLVNPGRGWIQVRATRLSADSLIAALERGDFYASTGVELRDVRFTPQALEVTIAAGSDETFVTEFVGTIMPSPEITDGTTAPASPDTMRVGVVLARVEGIAAEYRFSGNELYVRARVTSSRPKANARPGEMEMAWTQPVLP